MACDVAGAALPGNAAGEAVPDAALGVVSALAIWLGAGTGDANGALSTAPRGAGEGAAGGPLGVAGAGGAVAAAIVALATGVDPLADETVPPAAAGGVAAGGGGKLP